VRDYWVGGTQPRARRFCFGVLEGGEINAPAGLGIEWAALMMPLMEARSIVADSRIGSTGSRVRHKGGGKRAHGESGSPARVTSIADACEAMGLARDFTDHMPFTMHGKRSAIGNGVPLPMGRAVARAVTEALRGR